MIFGIILVGCQNNLEVNSPSDSQSSLPKVDEKVSQAVKYNSEINLLATDWYVRGHGYWKTHSKYGPAKDDPTWGNSPANFNEDTEFFLSDKSFYEVIWTNPVAGNVYYILSREYIALRLNARTGAPVPTDIWNAYLEAEVLFGNYTPDDIKSLKGNNPLRKQFLNLATVISAFNQE
jgi:hypothetical protein